MRHMRRGGTRARGVGGAWVALFAMLALVVAVVSGCVLRLDSPSGSSGGHGSGSGAGSGAGGAASVASSGSGGVVGDPMTGGGCDLPDPEFWWRMPPDLTPEQQARADEVCLAISAFYKSQGYKIVVTTQGPESGDIYDWVDENTVPGADATPPPPPPPEALVLPFGVFRQKMEVELHPEMQGPPGTIPIIRKGFWGYVSGMTDATSLSDWIKNYQVIGKVTAASRDDLIGRTHAGFLFPKLQNQGANVNINAFGANVENDALSLMEMVVGCRALNNNNTTTMWQQVGIMANTDNLNVPSRFPSYPITGYSVLRLDAEFLTEGDAANATGHDHGGVNSFVTGFVPIKGTPYAPGSAFAAATLSTVDGPQFESLFQIKIDDNGDWWIGHNGNWLGYYPHTLFQSAATYMIKTHACEVDYYSEVGADITEIGKYPRYEAWTSAPMGSGHQAKDGFGKSSYFRDPTYVANDGSNLWAYPDPVKKPNTDIYIPPPDYAPKCYTSTPLMAGPAPWDLYFYVGGQGITTGCN